MSDCGLPIVGPGTGGGGTGAGSVVPPIIPRYQDSGAVGAPAELDNPNWLVGEIQRHASGTLRLRLTAGTAPAGGAFAEWVPGRGGLDVVQDATGLAPGTVGVRLSGSPLRADLIYRWPDGHGFDLILSEQSLYGLLTGWMASWGATSHIHTAAQIAYSGGIELPPTGVEAALDALDDRTQPAALAARLGLGAAASAGIGAGAGQVLDAAAGDGRYLRLAGGGLSGPLILAGPAAGATEPVTLAQAQAMLAGASTGWLFKVRTAVRAGEGSVDLAAAPAVIGGVAPAIADMILLMGQTIQSQNGVYRYAGVGQPMTRHADVAVMATLAGSIFSVVDGAAQGTVWLNVNDMDDVLGTAAVRFEPWLVGVYQPAAPALSVLSGIVPASGTLPIFTGAASVTTTAITAWAQGWLAAVDAAAGRAALGLAAATVPVTPTGALTQTDVQAALASLAADAARLPVDLPTGALVGYRERAPAPLAVSGVVALGGLGGGNYHILTLAGPVTSLTLPDLTGEAAATVTTIHVLIRQDSVGGRTIGAWSVTGADTLLWDSGAVPTLAVAPNSHTLFVFSRFAGLGRWLGARIWKEV